MVLTSTRTVFSSMPSWGMTSVMRPSVLLDIHWLMVALDDSAFSWGGEQGTDPPTELLNRPLQFRRRRCVSFTLPVPGPGDATTVTQTGEPPTPRQCCKLKSPGFRPLDRRNSEVEADVVCNSP